MLPLIIVPIACLTIKESGKKYIRFKEEVGIIYGTKQATEEGSKKIKIFLKENSIVMFLNITIIIFSVLVFSKFSLNFAKFMISSVYASSVLYSIYGIIKKYDKIIMFIYFKFNPKLFLKYEIFKEVNYKVKKEYTSSKETMSAFLGGRGSKGVSKAISDQTTKNLIQLHTVQFLWFIAVFFIYIFIFRFFTIGILLDNYVHLNTIQAFFYPFFISFKYFF